MSENKHRQPSITGVLVGGILFVLGAMTGVGVLIALQWMVLVPPSEVPLKLVELPNAEARPLIVNAPVFIVGINAAGEVEFEGAQRTKEEMRQTLSSRANEPGLQVVIRMHPQAEFRHAAEVMNLCNQLSIYDYKFGALRSED